MEPYEMRTIYAPAHAVLFREDIDSIMEKAIKSINCYWGQVTVIGELLGENASEQITRGGELEITDPDSGKKYCLDLKKFLNGMELYLGEECHIRYKNDHFSFICNNDNEADYIIQYALFGEVVYTL